MKKKMTKKASVKSPKAKSKLNTHQFLLQTAAKSLVQNGVHGLRYSQIAKMADVPQPLMGYHFPTHDALMMEMIQVEVEKLRHLSTESIEKHSDSPAQALRAYIQTPFLLCKKDAQFRAVWTAFLHLTTVNRSFAELNRQLQSFGKERIRNLITLTLAMERKLPDSMAQLDSWSTAVQGVVTGMTIMVGTVPEGDFEEMAEQAVHAAMAILGVSS